MSRSAEIIRNTSETKIKLFIDLDGSGASEVDTGIGFFDHMLISFAKHGFFFFFCSKDEVCVKIRPS